jgi:uncharacterized protein YPO0396
MATVAEREAAHADLDRELETRRAEALAETERLANEMVGAARREEMRLTARLEELRVAVDEVESAVRALTTITEPHIGYIAEVIDLTAPESAMAGRHRN